MSYKLERLLYLDVLRALSILGVILIHIIGASFHYWEKGSLVWTVFISTDQLFRFSVPLFVFISGFTLYAKYNNNFNFWKFYKKRIVRILPWYVVWSLVIYLYIHFTVVPGFVNYPTWKLILLGKVDYHLYFVSMIIQLYLLFPLLLWIFKKFKLYFVLLLFILEAALYTALTLDGQKIIHLPWRLYEQQQYLFFGTWIFYFVFGFWVSSKNIVQASNFRKHRHIFLLLATAILAYAIYNSLQLITATTDTNVATRSTRIPILLYSTLFIFSAFLYLEILLKINEYLLKVILYFANLSFLVYLTHTLVIRILGNFILPNSLFNLFIFTTLVFSASILLAQLSVFVASKIPFRKFQF